ncbi:aminotransferase class III-fold pyridoxal phosphate-dependent enzyme [Aminobacter aminovorans]|jgi:4-aminobutyrate aminotransferase-like enzyme/Ser/Thr protein kinase RdoA (MazF antagonist)|uniref:4-aminobutyrate aminotransferase-like enzyme/Ser/Thr protein kinase RdoA (MazF antagonist) n=1 Tax=Aminobacter aminovorans TaxID=83263 RepID=A0AAC8YSV3_AMIAI|nr:aminotransferase class III-fold pyridoxal phosphate-dependent enzyme [Aminobacter aminovorans]AMS43827.1 Aminotransferase class-III protein [Aminobacter aminovorans]MBB3707347.1 4-aminobutyrate aminotransferase-like enzyme/Ser/Thr protein kinase RdoA (MazF antagonist) [Aminobacter aminovorans]
MTDVTHPAPAFSFGEAADLASSRFGVSGRVAALDSERDQNFRLSADDGAQWILKIINASEPASESEFQVALLDHLARSGVAAPRLKPSADGAALSEATGASGERHALRLVSWLPGLPLAEAARTPKLLENLGRALGRLDGALQGFIHPGAIRSFDWDIRQAGAARQRLHHVPDVADRALLRRLLDHFDVAVAPRLAGLRAQVIHNDANDWNVLVDEDDLDRVAGIIDFGDALHSPVIAEVAVACAYSILDVSDPIGAAATLAAGFHAEYPLREEELDLLFDLIAMRLVISVTLSAQRKDKTGDNPYLAISEAPAWRLLRRLGAMNRRFATAILRHACGFEATPGARAVTAWIEANRKSFAPVLDRHPATLVKALVPYGDPAHPMTTTSAGQEPDKATAWWDAWCAEHGVELGIGPWGEARTVYTSDIFWSRFVEGARRVHHLGLDLFLPAGTKVYTPLAATVKSVEIEEDPLGYGCLIALEHTPEGCPPFGTLWGHMAHEAMARLKPGETLEAGALVGEMGAPTENGGWAPHLHFQISTDPELAARDILGVGEARYLDVWAELFPDAATLAGIPPETFHQTGRTRPEIVAARKASLLPNLSISYSDPIKFVRGEGAWLIDDRGRAYLDCFNNVCHLGHAHPDVVEATATQAARLNTNTRYLHDAIVTYAERLTATLPEGLSVASFACSGSEANSLALRMSRTLTGSNDALVLDWAYHGTTQELIDLSPYKYKRKGGKGRPAHVFEATIPDSYHAPDDWPVEEHARRFAESIAEQIETMRTKGRAPAFFIAESIPSVAGQVFLPEGYLKEVYAMVRAAGGFCIADEVQVGFGRVGSHWWAFETQGVTPDIVTMGKPIGNGHPMSALVTTREIADRFNNGMEYFNTFGGNPVSCAAGLAVLDVIERDRLRDNAADVGAYLVARFREMQQRYEVIGDVRGQGLFLGVELVTDRKTKAPATAFARKVNDGARARGVLIGTEGPHDNVLKMRPPMIFSRADADHLVGVLEEAFAAASVEGA